MNQTDRIISALYLAKSNNREKVLSDLILNVLYSINQPIDIDSINDFIKKSFHLEPIKYELQECLNSLVESNDLMFKEQLYSLTEISKQNIYTFLLKSDSETEKRKHTFYNIVKDIFDGNVNEDEIKNLWIAFNEYLIECFMVFGRKAIKIFLPYEVDEIDKDDKIFENAYKKLEDEKLISIFKQLIVEYPERLNEAELRYLTLLASRAERFYSLGVEKKDYDKILNLQIKDLVVMIDTNILYSILNLHIHPEKPAILELLRIAKEKQVDIKIMYLPKTYSELQKAKVYLEKLIPKENFKISQIKALLHSDKLDPFAKQYYENKLNNSEFPHPSEKISYAKDFLKQLNVVIYNNRFPHLEDNESYINTKIVEYIDFQKYYNSLCEEKGYDLFLNKDDKKIEHDIFLRESVKDLKSKYTNENELRFICLTLDRSLIHFDNHIQRKESYASSKIISPNFILPSIFIKKIRPFIPITTNNYRKAFISSLTAPSFEKENVEETILVQKSMSYFKNLGIDDEEIILNCIKRELFLDDFAKHEKSETSEEFIKSEISIEIDKIKKYSKDLELSLNEKNIEASNILEEKNKIKKHNRNLELSLNEKNIETSNILEEKNKMVNELESTVIEKDNAINSLESRLKAIEELVEQNNLEKIEQKRLLTLEKKQIKWELDKVQFINEELEPEISKLKSSVKYFFKINIITIVPLLCFIILKAHKGLNVWIEQLGQNQWWIWGGLISIQSFEIFGRSYLFDKEKIKVGWRWVCASFDKSMKKDIIINLKESIEAKFIKQYGKKPTE